ncbi:FKBP-type peptidyl-prolyl cis-trans isomerase [Mariniluteicoccus flavus]
MNRRLLAASLCAAALVLPACSKDKPAEPATASPSAAASAAPSASASATPTPTPTPTPKASVAPSTNLDAIKVEGERLKEPKVEFPAPWAIDETKTKVIQPGDGPTVQENGTVEVHYYGVNGRTGKKFDDSFSRGQAIAFPLDQVVPGFKKGLANQKVGSRVVVAMPGKDGYDPSGGSPQAGIEVGDSLVFVVDIVSTTMDKPEGDVVPPKEGQPSVTADPQGNPVVKIAGDRPSQLVVQPVIAGRGKKVQAQDTVTVRYMTVGWDGRVIESTYGKAPEQGPLPRLVPAWAEGLVNQPVGSRVMIVSPPDKAYPQGNENPKIQPGETLVFVVDILFSQAAQ